MARPAGFEPATSGLGIGSQSEESGDDTDGQEMTNTSPVEGYEEEDEGPGLW